MPKHEWVLAICRNSTTRADPNPGHTVYLDNLRPFGISGKGMLARARTQFQIAQLCVLSLLKLSNATYTFSTNQFTQ